MSRLLSLTVGVTLLAVACSADPNGDDAPAPPGADSGSPLTGVTAVPWRPADPPAAEPFGRFVFDPQPLPASTRERMTGPAWRTGCPVALDDLRTIRLTFWGFDGLGHEGTLVVHADAVATMQGVFAELHAARFPIRQIRPIEDYGGDDDASMDADNTSAFNCRPSAGTSSTWSQHAYGRAIDINPRENPYVSQKGVAPKAGEAFVDRSQDEPGVITPDSAVVRAFDRRGWGWGGRWENSKDYQHFSANGR